MELDEAAFDLLARTTLARWGGYFEDEGPDGLECEQEEGILTLVLDGAGTFLLNRHAASRQLWLSSPFSGASHYAWDGSSRRWLSTRDGADLAAVLTEELGRASGAALSLPAVS